MTHDKFIGSYISAVKHAIDALKTDMLNANFQDLYQVGRMQGAATGLQMALDVLEELYAEEDQ